MKEIINLVIIQSPLEWENTDANLSYFEARINEMEETVDLVLLPETFATGFTMQTEVYADKEERVLGWMKRMAAGCNIHLAGSCIIREEGKYFNRLYWVSPEGGYISYDKRHLFRMGREQEHFSPGNKRVIVRIGKFRVLLQICYDLRFPVFSRNREDYDVILYVANWPAARSEVWDILLKARAIENQSYVIGVNRIGRDGEGVDHHGGSCLIDPKGKIKARLEKQPGLLYTSMHFGELKKFRENFPVYKDADHFRLS